MSDAPFLEGYDGQSTDELLALDGPYRTDSVVLAFEAAIMRKVEGGRLESLTDAERTVVAIEALEREVHSDGYVGLFATRAEVVPYLVEALRMIGQDDVAANAQRAIDIVAARSLDAAAIQVAAEEADDALLERLHAADEAYYATAGDLATPLLAFIREHRAEIVIP
jgi:hypothetical protein